MILIVLLSIIAFSHGEKLDKTYLPPNAHASGGSSEILQPPTSRPIVVVNEEAFQRQIAETVKQEEEIQRTIVNNIEFQRPIVTNVVTDSAALQRPTGFTLNVNNQETNDVVRIGNNQAINDVVRIGNRGNIYVQNQTPVEYKEVNYQGPRYQLVEQRQERTQAALERNAAILRQEYKNEGDAYAYAYETENGIWAEQNGVATNGVNAQGAFSYIGDDGVQYSMSYTADENGFQPKGDHIPSIPEEILRSLEQNARDEAAGIFDDGSYDERKYGGEYSGYQKIVSVVTSRPNIPTFIQSYSTPPTIIRNQPTVSTVIQNYPTVPTIIDQGESNENAVSNSLLFKYRTPGYRYPTILVNNQRSTLAPVNSLIQEVTPSTVSKVYLPVKRKVESENRSSKLKRKTVVIKRNRKPESKKDDNKS